MTVYLLGAGPGDPGLITVKGAEVLQNADAVVYDRLAQFMGGVSRAGGILDLAPSSAEKIYVGKTPEGSRLSQASAQTQTSHSKGSHTRYSQEEINELLISLAGKYETVVRLKGGDPFVFARGGEEAEALLLANVDFEIIPGISSPIAVPAYAGIPVTLRHSSTSFTVITGHEDPSATTSVNWALTASLVADLDGTLVILMGASRWEAISKELLDAGLSPDTPVAAISWGTRPNQATIRATLASLQDHTLEPPLTIVVGKVAEKNLNWFEKLPLFGKKILITRARLAGNPTMVAPKGFKSPLSKTTSGFSQFSQGIFRAGGEPVEVPLIEILPPSDAGEGLRTALSQLLPGDWLVCTSPNGVLHLLENMKDARTLGGIQVAAIGPATADVFRQGNIQPDLIPDTYVAEALLEAFPAPTHQGQKVLLARAAKAREVLPEGLAKKGYEVIVKEAYQTHEIQPNPEDRNAIAACDVVTFASPSAVHSYNAIGLGAPKLTACIGPVTAQAAKNMGFEPHIVAQQHTTAGLISALTDHFGSR